MHFIAHWYIQPAFSLELGSPLVLGPSRRLCLSWPSNLLAQRWLCRLLWQSHQCVRLHLCQDADTWVGNPGAPQVWAPLWNPKYYLGHTPLEDPRKAGKMAAFALWACSLTSCLAPFGVQNVLQVVKWKSFAWAIILPVLATINK